MAAVRRMPLRCAKRTRRERARRQTAPKMFASLFVLASTPFKTCVSADHMHLSDLTLSPDPPVHGEHVSLKITSTPDIAITAGTVTVAVTVFGIPVPGAPTYDLCTEVGFRCPLAPAKPVAASVDYRVSPHVPPGIDATISLQIKDGDGAEIGCASFDVKVGGAEGGGLPGGGKHAEARRQLGAREQQAPQQQAQQAQAQGACFRLCLCLPGRPGALAVTPRQRLGHALGLRLCLVECAGSCVRSTMP